ncbi:MAG TPA: S-layer homology domain-containing protein [Thermoanaerobaculia bacterium]|jgi:hypothetical protein
MRRTPAPKIALALGSLALAAALTAQDPSGLSGAPTPHDYGVGNVNILQIPAAAFLPTLGGAWTFDANFYFLPATAGAVYALAPVQLPTGSKITHLGVYYDDTDGTNDVSAFLFALPGYDATATKSQLATVSSSGSGGKGYASAPDFTHTVNNNVRYGAGAQLVIEIYVPSSSAKFKAVDLWWTRQVSPAPGVATFVDVPTNHPFFVTIEAFAKSGATSGCGGGQFCPNGTVTRQELAKFFVRSLGLYWPDTVP